MLPQEYLQFVAVQPRSTLDDWEEIFAQDLEDLDPIDIEVLQVQERLDFVREIISIRDKIKDLILSSQIGE